MKGRRQIRTLGFIRSVALNYTQQNNPTRLNTFFFDQPRVARDIIFFPVGLSIYPCRESQKFISGKGLLGLHF